MNLKWICPECGAENTDDPNQTALPLCEGCDKSIQWWEVILSDEAVAACCDCDSSV